MTPSRETRVLPTKQAKDGRLSAGFRQSPPKALVFGAVMQADRNQRAHSIPLKHYGLILVGVWTLVVAASLGWNLLQDRDEDLRVARQIALTNYERDVLYRRWAAGHGGVYVPVTPDTPPTPYLAQLPERDIVTPSGRRLTLLNPAYMTRKVYELAQQARSPPGAPDQFEAPPPPKRPRSMGTKGLGGL